MLDELLLGGEVQESSKKNVLKAIAAQDLLQEVSVYIFLDATGNQCFVDASLASGLVSQLCKTIGKFLTPYCLLSSSSKLVLAQAGRNRNSTLTLALCPRTCSFTWCLTRATESEISAALCAIVAQEGH